MKKAMIVPMMVVIAIASFILGSTIVPGFAADDTANNPAATASVDETNDGATTVESKKIFLYNSYLGVALTDSEVNSLLRQAEAQGLQNSTFVVLATTGEEIEDSASGMTFVVRKGTDYVNLSDGADIYEVGNCSLSQLTSGGVEQESFKLEKRVQSSYGAFNLYVPASA